MPRAVPRAAATSACVMAAGDVLCQRLRDARDAGAGRDGLEGGALSAGPGGDVVERAASAASTSTANSPLGEAFGFQHDAARTGRFFVVGAALHGPFFSFAFGRLERAIPGACARSVAKKVAIGHGVLFPTYTVGFFYAMSALEGKGLEHGTRRLEAQFLDAFAAGTMFWPFANALNFAFVPSRFRLLYLNFAGVAWNAFLSNLVSEQSSDANGARASSASAAAGASVVVASARESRCID